MSESSTDQPTFEQALAKLEVIVRDLEQGTLGLAESLGKYEEGVKLLGQCQQLLDRAERRIELLTGVTATGEPVVQSFADTPTLDQTEAGGSKARSRKRTAASRGKSGNSAEINTGDPPDSTTDAMDGTRPLF